ncbi:hypothetical protein ACFQ10_11320 [Streptomyces indonesiensis]
MPPGSGYGLHALAADDVWAAGATDLCAAVSHWDRQAWQQTIVDGFPRSAVGSVLAVSPTEVGGRHGRVRQWPCACRIPRPCRSRGMSVCMEDATKAVVASYVEVA